MEGSLPTHCTHRAAGGVFRAWLPWESVQDRPHSCHSSEPSGAGTTPHPPRPQIHLYIAAAASPFHGGERPPVPSPPASPAAPCESLSAEGFQCRGPCSSLHCPSRSGLCPAMPAAHPAARGAPQNVLLAAEEQSEGWLEPGQSLSVSPPVPACPPARPRALPASPLPALMAAGRAGLLLPLPLRSPAPPTAQGWMEQPP